MVDETTVGLELRFTGAAHADAAAKLLQVRPHPREAREHVLELRELHLHLCLARARARREDVQDQLGTIHHALARGVLDVLPLRRRELVIEDDERCVRLLDERAELLDLPFPEVRRGIRTIDLLSDASDDDGAGSVRELLELIEMLVDVVPRRRSLARRADEKRSLDRRGEGDQVAGDETTPSKAAAAIGVQL
jgi:hypothetical protein